MIMQEVQWYGGDGEEQAALIQARLIDGDVKVSTITALNDGSIMVVYNPRQAAQQAAQPAAAAPAATPNLPAGLPPDARGSNCNRCGQQIYWSDQSMSNSGKKIPLDPSGQSHDCPQSTYNQTLGGQPAQQRQEEF
jgi:hypothetical protein